MATQQKPTYSTAFLIIGALFVIWGILGVLDQPNVPYSGYSATNNTVTRIYPGSPAEQAGLRVGDHITSIGGISVQDSRARRQRERAVIGSTRTFIVEPRLGAAGAPSASRSVDITYTALPGRDSALRYASFIIGLCFVVWPLGAYLKVVGKSATLLALVGLCLSIGSFSGPYFSSYFLRLLANSVSIIIILLGFACLLHLMLEFPKRSAFLAKAHALKIVYGPAALIALFVLYFIIFSPLPTSTPNPLAIALIVIFLVAYFGLPAIAMVRSFVKATPEERSDHGLNFLLAAILIVLIPLTFAILIGIFAPRMVLPGSDFYSLTVVLVPIALAMAVRKKTTPPTAARVAVE